MFCIALFNGIFFSYDKINYFDTLKYNWAFADLRMLATPATQIHILAGQIPLVIFQDPDNLT